ncbi:hypothetical protein K493DRAFT_321673 [Basidiobolus meristosporus CBS 931.73]|uniref:Band 7 domain-containing protein n=1 Tax=Basidiobolus meristosporus CBS 931.73 TaxID=1314790 RepID=A0A1Y1WPZ7_9FUNG|nr:hypothetical protein K493DRAFT_321673 [Basidiobolus meristosporus CBS 931.73]|eukprot:ORX75603.1 hypothetical protein K493DRAFT_321673 [Basidiobolus meristosporus CBS 931.73]
MSKKPSSSTQPEALTTQPSSHAMSKSFAKEIPAEPVAGFYGVAMQSLGNLFGALGSIPGCFCCPNPNKEVDQGYVGLISRFGRVYKCVDPGLTTVNVFTEKLHSVDIKLQIALIEDIRIMTKDNVNIKIDSVVYYHVVDPYQSLFGVGNVRQALIERTQTTLRGVLGTRVLQDCIENRETIADDIREMIDIPAREWGVTIESILIKDLEFSKELQESLSSAATQKRIGESKVISAQAEVDSAKLMREAAEILNTPAAMQIRYLETLSSMSKNTGTKVIFMPLEQGSSSNAIHKAVIQNQLAEM